MEIDVNDAQEAAHTFNPAHLVKQTNVPGPQYEDDGGTIRLTVEACLTIL